MRTKSIETNFPRSPGDGNAGATEVGKAERSDSHTGLETTLPPTEVKECSGPFAKVVGRSPFWHDK